MAIWLPNLNGRSGPKYLQIVEAMAEDIASGRLAPGAQLPPHRELAYQIGVSANTTSRAYAEAVTRALLRGEVGRGSFVRAAEPMVHQGGVANSLRRDALGPIDLSRNLPLAGFSQPHIRQALHTLAEGSDLSPLLDYQSDADLDRHIDAWQHWLAYCGVDATRSEVMTTVGGQHALFCAVAGVLKAGDLLLTEALTYMPVQAMAERLGVTTTAVAMDPQGVQPEAFEALCRHARPRAFYLTPTLQAPTTVTLDDERRAEIAEIAMRHDVILIEDDVFAPLKPDRPAPLATHAPDHTIYVTSLSKSVTPGLRVGILKAPQRLMPALRHAANLSLWMAPPLTAEIGARLILDGTAETLAEQQRRAAQHRQTLARSVLSPPGATPMSYQADPQGLHLWLPLPPDLRADVFRAQCAQSEVLVSEGRSFALAPGDAPEAVRLCLSHEVSEDRLTTGLQRVAHLLRESRKSHALQI
ncbi:PLP-dependent aminotransferase family protein [Phaeobacter inhibens]|uniref:aminotransferase-like domain-containing protein n=1 Tax=Phaeobacter inhibens TaxID=221822 RepID=UPI0021A4C42A|nr:PLP-dependent aminotransferase family protein [Phaeobacter inhibens]UWR91951.1 PLP-dependent aminotransferase family protein [Phaeobacter inhibens]